MVGYDFPMPNFLRKILKTSDQLDILYFKFLKNQSNHSNQIIKGSKKAKKKNPDLLIPSKRGMREESKGEKDGGETRRASAEHALLEANNGFGM